MHGGLSQKNQQDAKLALLKFLIFPALQIVTMFMFAMGAGYIWISPLLFIFLALACDVIPDRSKVEELTDLERWGSPILYASAAFQIMLVVGLLLVLRSNDPTPLLMLAAAVTLGVYNGAAGGNLSHELMHRSNPLDLTISRALSAMALHSTFTIDHLKTHHLHASRKHDAASAWRGQNFWEFAISSFISSNKNAAAIEATRLSKKGQNSKTINFQNRSFVGHVFELFYLSMALLIAGIPGLIAVIVGGVISIVLIEGFNYIAHYGLIRTDTGAYEARHAWSTRRVVSSGFTFNITQHSQHHLHPSWHFWEIEAQPNMPILPLGPSTLSAIAAVPPLWFRYMRPHLEHWDAQYASAEELALRE